MQDSPEIKKIRLYAMIGAVAWSLLLASLFVLYLIDTKERSLQIGHTIAQTSFDKDLLFRRWGARHGGVYVPETQATPANPYLEFLPEREISTPSGRRLTLVNPAYMSRQIFELAKEQADLPQGHLTSLTPLRAENAPDPWETEALKALEQGAKEVIKTILIDGQPHLRLMRPLLTENPCLACHAAQGYQEGSIRGGISTTISLAPIQQAMNHEIWLEVCTHLAIWLLGLGCLWIAMRKIVKTTTSFLNEQSKFDESAAKLKASITVHQQTEMELLKSNSQLKESHKQLQKLSNAVENSPVTIVITDFRGKIEYVNPKFTETTGYLPEEAIGQTPRILNSGIQATEFYREMWATISAGEEWRGDFCNRKKNGDLFWEHASISPIKDEQGVITHFVAIKEDVTLQRQIADDLKIAQDAAHAANRAKSDFLANMSHEIRTPLNAIIGFSSLALDSSLPPLQHDYLQKVNTAGTVLLSLINDILDFSKIEAGQLKMEQISFKLKTTLDNGLALLQQKALDKGLTLRVETAPEVDPFLVGDPHRLGQIIVNLLGNAIKFTASGGKITLLTSRLKQEKGRVQLKFSIRDTGIGLSAEQVAKLFQPFTQADGSTSRQFGGTGLGLSISKQLVELMEGEICCESTLGQGSHFCFTAWFGIAQEKDMEQDLASDIKQLSSKRRFFNFSGANILLVEDNETNQCLAIELLKKTGATVELAVNGKEAVAMIISGGTKYDLVLMDIQMPVMDGYEATRLIRAESHFSTLPIIAMTAHAMQDEKQKILKHGLDAVIAKPIDVQAMLETIGSFLGKQATVLPLAEISAAPPTVTEPVIPNIAGLDIAAALRRLDGNKKLYLLALRFFLKDYSDAATATREALIAGNTELAGRKAHSIKGIAGTLGAVELEKMAQALENAIASGEPPASISAALERFSTELERLVATLKKHPQAAPLGEDSTLPYSLDLAVVTPILNKLLDYIKVMDGKAERYLDDYQSELAGLPKQEMRQLNTHLKNFNFTAAGEAIMSLSAQHGIILTANNTKEFYS